MKNNKNKLWYPTWVGISLSAVLLLWTFLIPYFMGNLFWLIFSFPTATLITNLLQKKAFKYYSMTKELELLNAKRILYHQLLKLDEDVITDNEVEIMYRLSKDIQIQSVFETEKEK